MSAGRPRKYATRAERDAAYWKRKMQTMKVYHRSQTIEWSTPGGIFTDLDAIFHFSLDVALKEWMLKAYTSALHGATVGCLVPARTDTDWWHTYAMKGEITLLSGRLTFGGARNPAPFPSAVVIFRPPNTGNAM